MWLKFVFQRCREILQLSKSAFQDENIDIHTKLMRKHYKQVPEWWFICILGFNVTAIIFICEYYNDQLQLPWWGVLLACGVAISFTLPIGVIRATTNQVLINLCYKIHIALWFFNGSFMW